jgi:resuscitation-promoting factor RpfB
MRPYFTILTEFLNKQRRWLPLSALLMILVGAGLLGLGMTQTHAVIVAGETIPVRTAAWRVSAVLEAAHITLAEDDRLIPEGDPWLWAPAVIRIEPAREVIIRTPEDAFNLHTAEPIPANLLAAAEIRLFPQDRVLINGQEIDPHTPLDQDEALLIQVQPAVPIQLVVDGRRTTFFSDQSTLGAALEAANIRVSPQDWVSEDLMTPLEEGIAVSIRRARPVTVTAGETALTGLTAGTTVSEALADLGFTLQNLDHTLPPEDAPIPADGNIEVVHVDEEVMILKDEVAFRNEYVEDPNTLLDQVSVVTPGQPGIFATRERVQYVEGEAVWRDEPESWQASEAADGVLGYGSRVEVRTAVVDGQEIEYWRKISVYATSYSPCRLGIGEDVCSYRTASGLTLQKGMIGVTRNWFNMMRLQSVFVQGYGYGTIADIGGGGLYFNHYWIDLGYSEEDYQRWHHWTTMYFLTPVPSWYPALLPWP